jgi:uncharacterized membrane protein
MAAAGLALTLMVEIIAIKGDIGRMNTVFKFYLQAWTLLGLSSAFFLSRIIDQYFVNKHLLDSKKTWLTIFCILFASASLFLVTGTWDKVTDRISKYPTNTLDGMGFMKTSVYFDDGKPIDLNQDYEAIRWLQVNIKGSPVIIEANTSEYRWGNRISIYTGLPAVIGWNWHQRQQRAINPSNWITDRIDDVNLFFQTTDLKIANRIINEYQIDYIIVGQLEKSVYSQIGLEKFYQNPKYWRQIYANDSTTIFQVIK